MKIFIIGICCTLTLGGHTQTITQRSYPVKPGQQVLLKFDYPVVKISTWGKKEVAVTAHVTINGGDDDSAFVLKEENVNGVVVINDHIKDLDKLPRRYTVVRNGIKTIYKTRQQYQQSNHGSTAQQSYEGLDIDIVVEVKVPSTCITNIKSTYGIVEINNFKAPLTIDATYGGIDASLIPSATGKLQATTSYGQIYTNLDLKLTDHTDRDFFHFISAQPGTGPEYTFTSTYGKIYLRKL